MKNYRKLVPIVMVILIAVSWYTMIKNTNNKENEFNSYLQAARNYVSKDIAKLAMQNYIQALSMKDSPDIYVEAAKYLKTQDNYDNYCDWCETFLKSHPTEPKAYNCAIEAYVEGKDYNSCFSTLKTAEKRGINTDYLKSVREKYKYDYYIDYTLYDDVGVFKNGKCAVSRDNVWYYVDAYGKDFAKKNFTKAGPYSKEGAAPVVNKNSEAFYIDSTGEKILATKDKYKEFGMFVGNTAAAVKDDGKYVYVDNNLKKICGDYDFASAISGGFGAVENSSAWSIIKPDGKKAFDTSFSDVKLDDDSIAYRNERFMVKSEDKYIMIDSQGNKISKVKYDDAKAFGDNTYAAVKTNEKWGFVDKNGKMVIAPQYQDARSFKNGFAAVEVNGKWGFIDTKGKIRIEPTFFGCKDFNDKGSCFIQNGDKWQLLKVYSLNQK